MEFISIEGVKSGLLAIVENKSLGRAIKKSQSKNLKNFMENEKITSLHLFAGAGGGLLADLILGHDPVCAVEWDPYCCAVLRERAAEGWFPSLQVFEGDFRLFPASDWKGRVDCIHAGFPCQPHSVAGKRKDADDDRNLWPEVVRCLREIRPPWVFLENVPGIVSNGFIGTVLGGLAGLGYDARWTVVCGKSLEIPMHGHRWFCMASSMREGLEGLHNESGEINLQSTSSSRNVWETEPAIPRVALGIPARVDQIKGLGNSEVPLQAALAFKILNGER